jgi:copper chaperone CopZ
MKGIIAISGMHCMSCARLVTADFKAFFSEATVDLLKGSVVFTSSEDEASISIKLDKLSIILQQKSFSLVRETLLLK